MADPNNGDNFGAVYSDKAQYEAALAEWQRKKAAGDPFPGPMPRLTATGTQQNAMQASGFPTQIANQQLWTDITRAGANATPNANPFSTVIANQARPAQERLFAQMQAQMAGPSLAAMQGQRAQGQNLQAALAAGGGRPVMGQAGGVGAGLATDTASARLAEMLRLTGGAGAMASGVRGADLGVANASSQVGLQQRGLDDAMRQFYAQQGSGLNNTIGRNSLEQYKLQKRLEMQGKQEDMQKVDAAANILGPIFGGFLK